MVLSGCHHCAKIFLQTSRLVNSSPMNNYQFITTALVQANEFLTGRNFLPKILYSGKRCFALQLCLHLNTVVATHRIVQVAPEIFERIEKLPFWKNEKKPLLKHEHLKVLGIPLQDVWTHFQTFTGGTLGFRRPLKNSITHGSE